MKHLFTLIYGCILLNSATAQVTLPCGVDDRVLPDSITKLMASLPQLRASQQARKAAGEQRICRVAVEIDSDTYLAYAKDTNQIRSHVLTQMQQVSAIFEREINTRLTVVYIHIWKDTEPDPYRDESNAFTLYDRFKRTWSGTLANIASDKCIYLVTKQLSAVGGMGTGPYALSFLDIPIIAHELGHTFDSPHTHNCSWPGGPIDYCSSIEGSCYTESLEGGPGSLMSYCYPRLRTFHPLCQTLMASYAGSNLAVLNTAAQAPVLPAQLILNNTPFLYWNGQPSASRYDIDVSQAGDFSGKLLSDSTTVNGYDLRQLAPGQLYFVRVRSVNRLGVSGWSGVCQLQLATNTADVPILLSPTQDQTAIPYSNTKVFRVRPVAGATQYEVQLTDDNDLSFSSPSTSQVPPSDTLRVTSSYAGAIRWRMRALFGNRVGPWSTPARFFTSRSAFSFTGPSDNQAAPLTFPFTYTPAISSTTIRILVSTDQQFTASVYAHTFPNANTSSYSDVIRDLTANTTYYVRIDEINTRPDYPTGVLSRLITSFRTGTTAPSSAWSFINNRTRPDWPQNGSMTPLKVSHSGVWLINNKGLTRLNGDTIQTFDRQSTNGRIGNQGAMVSTDAAGAVWVINQISSPTFQNGFSVSYYQIGKLDTSARSLTDRVLSFDLKPVFFYDFDAENRLFRSTDAIFRLSGTKLETLYKPEAKAFIRGWAVGLGMVWLIKNNPSNTTTPYSLVRINLTTGVDSHLVEINTPQHWGVFISTR